VVLTGANDIAEEKPAHLEGWLEKKGHGHMVGGEFQKRYFSKVFSCLQIHHFSILDISESMIQQVLLYTVRPASKFYDVVRFLF
jgi:hypothetical protein